MHQAPLVLALLLFPVLASGADESAALKEWVKEHPIREVFPIEGDIPALKYAQQEKWIACLNSGLFPSELAYLADALVATGRVGNGERHRALTAAIAKVVSLNNFSTSTHESLSGYYPFVRTWLLINADPSRQKEPGGWVGMLQELQGLKLPPDAVARVMVKVLDTLDDSNWNKGLTSFQKLRFYLELAGIEHKQLQSRLFIHNWEAEPWSPLAQGDPKAVRDQLNALLKDRPERVSWAAFLFSWAWGNHWINASERLSPAALRAQNAKWAMEFRRVTIGTWLEGLAEAYVEHSDEPQPLVIYSLFVPAVRAEFHRLPLGLQHQTATAYALWNWVRAHPDKAEPALTSCMATIAKSLKAVADAPSEYKYLKRYATTGEVGRVIAKRYTDHPDSSRVLTQTLQQALDDVFAQDLGAREEEIRSSFEHITSLLEQFAFLDRRAKKAGK